MSTLITYVQADSLGGMAISQADSLDGMAISAEFEVRETVTVSDMCIHNVAVLIASLLRGRTDLEMGVRGVMVTLRGPKLKEINGFGLARNTHIRLAFVGHFIGIPIMKDKNRVGMTLNYHAGFFFPGYFIDAPNFFVRQLMKYTIDPDSISCNAFT